VADKRLKCQRATIGNKAMSLGFVPTAQTGLIEEIVKKPANYSGSFLLSYENIRDPYIQLTVKSVPECKIPSRVVQFLNMFSIEDLFDDDTYNNIEADLQEECAKYGPIDKIIIPRPDPNCGYSIPSIGKAFVKFMYIIPAKRARLAIAGKVYNKRTVVTSFYP
jgi:splicing factor U2AF subunit